MLKPVYTRQFGRDVKRLQKRGKDMEKLKAIVCLLLAEEPLDPLRRDHKLVGGYQGRRECHIEPDWLLIYKREANAIVFERSGTHADLFRG
ncbi:MAG TPA: type II toxin-antitoxin system YafQ family toxin [Planctomycetota bacterium]|nr:type II toxin-antitoxin system YafQ family toxin [Planctomycetota bacterium]